MHVFKKKPEALEQLVPAMGYCFATNKITIEGLSIGYMYREEPDEAMDSGWRFFSGTEDQAYIDDAENVSIYHINTIANHDTSILPYLHLPIGTELERVGDTLQFRTVSE